MNFSPRCVLYREADMVLPTMRQALIAMEAVQEAWRVHKLLPSRSKLPDLPRRRLFQRQKVKTTKVCII